ncbi:MMPL family transporter [Nocardia speluncae]|uniref:MMPL family transporter n=1 Tax=Nocardia speluncae TaxID=419477 RepID=A0A846XEF1_9NOCA|nr:MMPL family transporter [Nocardia speluncae]NKY33745.1 MMPL family transporter [Nocardia speluncae]
MSPLNWLGVLLTARPRPVLVAGLLLTVLSGVVGAGAMGEMILSRWEAPGTESVRAHEVLQREFHTGNANFILLVTAVGGSVDAAGVAAAGTALTTELRDDRAVTDAWSYWSAHGDPTLRSTDGRHAVVLAHVSGDPTTARAEIIDRLLPGSTRADGAVQVRVAGAEAVSGQISAQATQDFLRAELIIIPLMLLLLLLLYRRLRLALYTLVIGLFAVFATLAALRVVASFTEVSTFAANITLVMGIGLGVDYSLFVISRFREELLAGAAVPDAVRTAVATAGRTVIFSGLTVAAALSVLLVFPYSFLRSFAYAGVLVVVAAVAGSLVLLPAALAVTGHGALPRRARATALPEQGFWYRFGDVVMRNPVRSATAALLLLAVLAAPAAGLRIGLPDDRVLPPNASTRQAYDELRAAFDVEANDAVHFVAPAGRAVPAGDIGRYAAALSRIDGVARVNSTAGVFVGGVLAGPALDPGRLVSDTGTRLEAIPTRRILASTDVPAFIGELRAVPRPFDEVLVGGYPAELTDFRAVLTERIPVVAVLIALVTFVVLLAMSGSIVLAAKAIVLNLLSLAVMFGVLVFVFQNGAFAEVLGFTPIGTLDPAFPILLFCVAYGLSMDYEVFMLSRIAERYRITGDNRRAVLEGLQRGAPLVTSAALVLAVSFSLYATGQVMYLQMLGVGIAVAIVVDATVIRAVLVPAFMRLAGAANWWAPPGMRRWAVRPSGPDAAADSAGRSDEDLRSVMG